MIVVDVNILVYHQIDGPQTPLVNRLLAKEPMWATSAQWSFEFVNVLATMIRTDRITLDRALEILEDAEEAYTHAPLPISQDIVLETAAKYKISGYDAQYIALADWLSIPCITADVPLVRKVPHVAVLLAEFVQ